jgi:hypothetical protein
MAILTEKKISLKYIRNYILDNNISEKDTLLLNSKIFDDLALEHRTIYAQGITIPFYFLRVLITEDTQGCTSLNRIRIVRDGRARYEGDYDPKVRKDREYQSIPAQDKKIYQCHHCTNIVTANGANVSSETRTKQIGLLEQFKDRLSSSWIDICKECEDNLSMEV